MQRRRFTSHFWIAAIVAISSALAFGQPAIAQGNSAAVAGPVSLPDMALGPVGAPVTIIEYASLTCPHCADFNRRIFPRLKSSFIDSGKVRYVFREFPRDEIDAAGSRVARRIAKDDCAKYFAIVDVLFRQQDELLAKPLDTLLRIGKQAGLGQQAVEECIKDQALLDKQTVDRKFAVDVLKIPGTPTFFINGVMVDGVPSYEEFDKRITLLLKS